MDSLSSSSSRTVSTRDPGKHDLDEGDEESLINLNGLEIPNLDLCNSFEFMNEEDVFPDLGEVARGSPPLSPKTLAYRENVARESFDLGREEFLEGCNLDYISHYSNHTVNLEKFKSWVDFSNDYQHRIPKVEDRVWMMPEYGMHRILLILFDYGLRLPMHPFHLAIYESIGCGMAQLVPKVVA